MVVVFLRYVPGPNYCFATCVTVLKEKSICGGFPRSCHAYSAQTRAACLLQNALLGSSVVGEFDRILCRVVAQSKVVADSTCILASLDINHLTASL